MVKKEATLARLIAMLLLLVSGCSSVQPVKPAPLAQHPLMICVPGIARETGRPLFVCGPVDEKEETI